MRRTHGSKLTNKEAHSWLMNNDPEGAEFWVESEPLQGAVADNLPDFGEQSQSGYVQAKL